MAVLKFLMIVLVLTFCQIYSGLARNVPMGNAQDVVDKADNNKDGRLSYDEALTYLSHLRPALSRQDFIAAIQKLDAYHDRHLTTDEIDPDEADKNKDGVVNYEEAYEYLIHQKPEVIRKIVEDFVQELDTDEDEYISVTEIEQGLEEALTEQAEYIVKRADTDEDGALSYEETWEAVKRLQPELKQEEFSAQFKKLDTNNDDYITPCDIVEAHREWIVKTSQKIFDKADGDEDGEVSMEEAVEYILNTAELNRQIILALLLQEANTSRD